MREYILKRNHLDVMCQWEEIQHQGKLENSLHFSYELSAITVGI